jgi:hypothetical protein
VSDPSPSDIEEQSTKDKILNGPQSDPGEFNPGLAGGGGSLPSAGEIFEDWLNTSLGGGMYAPTGIEGDDRLRSDLIPMQGLGTRGAASQSDVIARVSGMSEAQLSYLQRRLFQAGFYEGAVYANVSSLDWGRLDNATINAVNAAMEKAGTNRVANFDQFLEQERIRFGQTGANAYGEDVSSTLASRREVNVVLSDPDSIRIIAERAGTELLGRKPTEQELAKINAQIWSEQRAAARVPATEEDVLAGRRADAAAALMQGESPFAGSYSPGDPGQLSQSQLNVVNTIVDVGTQMGLSEEYIVAAVSAGIVESDLMNLNYGDRDSVGVFQQRPSQGWGTVEQIRDVSYAARKFYEAMLVAKPGSNLGEWVANTQRPAEKYRGRYAEVMDRAAGIVNTVVSGQGANLSALDPNRQHRDLPPDPIAARHGLPQRTGMALPGDTTGLAQEREPRRSPITPTGGGVSRGDDGMPFWYDALSGSASMQDPIYREQFAVDEQASIEMALRQSDPKAYETRQAALRAYEFFGLLGAGGGAV